MAETAEKVRGVLLLSGGLDSILAGRIMLDEGIELTAVNFVTPFCNCTSRDSSCSASRRAAGQLGIELRVFSADEEYLEMVKNPRFGYGKNMNPCIDCRIYMFGRARDFMETTGASFLVTGEVLGERPMSQRRGAMKIIEREAGIEGLVLRPLSARYFEPTLPEEKGWVKRENLLAIHGRSRKPQFELAEKLGITDYPCPAGGCLLTDPQFAARMKDLFEHGEATINDVNLLKVGRHVRLNSRVKAVIGRNESENERLEALFREGDRVLEAADYPGPVTLVRGKADEEVLNEAAALTVRYGKARDERNVRVNYRRSPDRESSVERVIVVSGIKRVKA